MRGAIACALLAACAPADELERIERATDPIVNGQNDAGDPGVVGLTSHGQVFCTATLITPSIVLTAAHCLPPNTPIEVDDIDVYFGSGVGQGQALIGAHDVWANPLWNDNEWYEDIGLLQMEAIGPADPIPLNTTPIMDDASVRIVGFGVTSETGSDSGIKRVGTSTVQFSDQFSMQLGPTPSSTCYGDSGGPTLSTQAGTEYIAGVHSRGTCGFDSIEMRVDAYLSLIDAFTDSHPEPICAADDLCAAPCGEAIDPDCPCADDGLCTAACSDAAADPDCSEQCGPNGVCTEGCPIPDPDCSTCAADGVCVTSCMDDPDCTDQPECEPQRDECCGDECADDQTVEGCSVVGTGAPRVPLPWLAGLALLGLRIRVERRGRRRGELRARPGPR